MRPGSQVRRDGAGAARDAAHAAGRAGYRRCGNGAAVAVPGARPPIKKPGCSPHSGIYSRRHIREPQPRRSIGRGWAYAMMQNRPRILIRSGSRMSRSLAWVALGCWLVAGGSTAQEAPAAAADSQLAESHTVAKLAPTSARRLFVLDTMFPAAEAAKTYILDGSTGALEG